MRRQQLTAGLLTFATVMFVWGALAERSGRHNENASGRVGRTAAVSIPIIAVADEHSEGGSDSHSTPETERHESGGGDVHGAGHSESTEPGGHHAERTENRKILGINLESGWVIAFGAMISLILAASVLTRRDRVLVIAIVIVAIGFVVLEIAEVQHQHGEGRTGLVAIAAIAGLSHFGAGVGAASLLSRPTRSAAAN